MCDMASVVRFLCVCLCVSVVTCQFGFFPQREERRYATYQFSPNLNTIRDRLTGILQLRPENQNSDRRFIFPFQNTGIVNQNQRPQFQNQNRQPQYIQNYPNQNQYYQNYGQYQNNQNGNGFVSFPQQPNNFIENPDYSNGQNQGNFNEQNQFEPKSVDDSTVMFGEENNGANGIPNVPPNGIPSEPPNGFPNQPFNGIPNQPPNGIPNEPPNGFPNQPPNGIPNEPPNGIPSQPPNGIPSELPKNPLSPLSDPVTALAPLAPVPEAEKRNNFNFGPAGIFSEICQTVEQKPGNCINIIKCQPYIRILQDSRNNPRAVQILRRAHCGFEGNNPKVCCPLQGIPNTPAPVTTTTTTTTTTVAPNPEPSGKGTSEDFVPYFPEPPECGVSNASFSRVVGGVKAKLGDFPWMALLGYKSRHGPGARWLCGGSLISSKHVLTAAHCIHGRENDLFVVRLGELDLESETEGATPTDVLIKEKIKHEQYSATAFTNDIGILVLDRTITFTELIKPICIPKQVSLRSMTFENYNPIIAGWGDTEFRGPSATHLMALQLPVVSNSYCAQAYSAYKAQTIDDRVLCAGYKQGGRDACQGDSGGPLMQPIYDEVNYLTHFYQIGVVSYGRKCAEAGFPGVYSRVTHFVPWLAEKVLGQAQS